MKYIIALGITFLFSINAKAQSYLGFLTDNYSGIHSSLLNPANVVDSRFKSETNIISSSGLAGNDYYGVSFQEVLQNNYDFNEQAKTFPGDSQNGFVNIDILGPSFMLNLLPNHSIGFFSRGRSNINVFGIDSDLLSYIADDIESEDDFITENNNVLITSNSWVEVGVNYGLILYNKDRHFIKGGTSIKYLYGMGNGYIKTENLSVNYDADGIQISPTETTGSIESSGNIIYGSSSNFDTDDFDNTYEPNGNASGLGIDLGFVYEYRRKEFVKDSLSTTPFKNQNKYILKVGVSVTDLGSLTYKGFNESTYDVTNTINEDAFEDTDGFKDALDTFYTLTETNKGEKAHLPTALHLNIDWNVHKKLYLNLNSDISMRSADNLNTSNSLNAITLTPRFETKWFSFYSPASVMKYSGFSWGAGLRFGPLFVGSGSVLSNLISDQSKEIDLYFGLKVPIYQGKKS